MQLDYIIWDDGSPDLGMNVTGHSSVINYSRALEEI